MSCGAQRRPAYDTTSVVTRFASRGTAAARLSMKASSAALATASAGAAASSEAIAG